LPERNSASLSTSDLYRTCVRPEHTPWSLRTRRRP
jgi:hypothetical protein